MRAVGPWTGGGVSPGKQETGRRSRLWGGETAWKDLPTWEVRPTCVLETSVGHPNPHTLPGDQPGRFLFPGCSSKWGSWASISWELGRTADFRAHPDGLHQTLRAGGGGKLSLCPGKRSWGGRCVSPACLTSLTCTFPSSEPPQVPPASSPEQSLPMMAGPHHAEGPGVSETECSWGVGPEGIPSPPGPLETG